MRSSSSQADSAGSIPVTRYTREKPCGRTELENSSSLRIRVFGPYPGHLGPHISTPRHSTFQFQKDAQLVLRCRLGSSNLSRPRLRRNWGPNVDVLDLAAAKKHLRSH